LHIWIKHKNSILLSLELLHVRQGEIHLSEPPRLATLRSFSLQNFLFCLLLLLGDLVLSCELFNEVFIGVTRAVDVVSLGLAVLSKLQLTLADTNIVQIYVFDISLIKSIYLRKFFAFLSELDIELKAFLLFVEALFELVQLSP